MINRFTKKSYQERGNFRDYYAEILIAMSSFLIVYFLEEIP
jgi:hypothetical protein